ncbi:MAG: carboxypeptidase-like regulatory domain-containing protein, partial [Thermoplasmata archaeon]
MMKKYTENISKLLSIFLIISFILLYTNNAYLAKNTPNTISNENISNIWSNNLNLINDTLVPVGNVLGTNHINFIVVKPSDNYYTTYLISGQNGTVIWSLRTPIIQQYIVVNISSNTQGLLILTSQYLTMYSITTSPNIIWQQPLTGNFTGFLIGNTSTQNIIYAYSVNTTSTSNFIYIYAINIEKGNIEWTTQFNFIYYTSNIFPFFPIPKIGNFDGGILINPNYSYRNKNSNTTQFFSYISLINGTNGNVEWNITNPNVGGVLSSISIGMFTSTSYQIAVGSSNVREGYVGIININGTIDGSFNGANMNPWFAQQLNINIFQTYYHIEPSVWINPLPYNNTNGYNDLILEETGYIDFKTQKVIPPEIEEINLYNNVTIWKQQLPMINSTSYPLTSMLSFIDYVYIPSTNQIIVINQMINKLYVVSDGLLTANLNVLMANNYFNLTINPSIIALKNNAIVIPVVNQTGDNYNVSFINTRTGKVVGYHNLYFSNEFTTIYIEPISIVTENFLPTFAFIGVSNNNGHPTTLIEALTTNGNIVFSQEQNGSLQYIMGTYFYNSFYPGINNAQLSNEKISDYILSTSLSISAWSVSLNNITPLQIQSFTSNKYNGIAPLNVSFNVNVSGGVSPYTYNWNISNIFITTQVSYINYTLYIVGTYNISVQITDSIGEKVKSNILTLTVSSTVNVNKNYYYNVTGYVTSSSGIPLNGVIITTNNSNQTVTNSRGIFFVDLPNGTWEIKAQKSGYYTA